MFYFRAGSTVGSLLSVSAMRDGALMRYFRIAASGAMRVRYRNIIRLSEANMLLAETGLPIAEIAARLGYPGLAGALKARALVESVSA